MPLQNTTTRQPSLEALWAVRSSLTTSLETASASPCIAVALIPELDITLSAIPFEWASIAWADILLAETIEPALRELDVILTHLLLDPCRLLPDQVTGKQHIIVL